MPQSSQHPTLSPSQARIQTFRVVPSLPEPLKPLLTIANNIWWTWNYEAVNLFSKLDRDLWEETNHNPVKMLGLVSQERLDRAAADRSFLHALTTIHAQLQEHLQSQGWFAEAAGQLNQTTKACRIAYFCAEFGLAECMQIYSGGLGLLAGDHLKSASELGIPLVAVGLLYRRGYFHQYLNPDGYQQETYHDLDAPNQPIQRVIDPANGQQRKVHVELPGRRVALAIWRCDVGRIPLYLLDANLPENSREDRDITANLYGGDVEQRIKQEIVLGVGGVRALAAVGEEPSVIHINEGHAAFAALERIAKRREGTDLTFDQAREAVASGNIFTTHTPVPAGIDRFPPAMVETYLGAMMPALGLDVEGLLALGRENTADRKEFFSMAVLAIRTSRFCNGVSELHGHVSRRMWKGMWPGTPEQDVPIGHVTNGVHPRFWISGDLTRLFDRYLSDRWHDSPQDPQIWNAIDEIPDEELWSAHCRRREHMVAWCRKRIRTQLAARGAGQLEIDRAAAALDTDALTIGFARRFATYKRGTLLFRDVQRLAKLLGPDKPVQLVVSGKSHPADGGGKQLIRDIVNFVRDSGYARSVVFLEDYDIQVARRLVQGCDIWLNNPIRGLEASGTSGMKAAMNGCIHASILDGWWAEGFDPEAGFAIGRGEDYEHVSRDEMDDIESRALYQLLESQIVPEFYDRDDAGIPRKWVQRMKRCIKKYAPFFSTHRMVADYCTKFYFPAHNAAVRLNSDNARQARELANHVDHFRYHWSGVAVREVSAQVAAGGIVSVRTPVRVLAKVALGQLRPDEVLVQLYHGLVTSLGEIVDGSPIAMKHVEALGDGLHSFAGVFSPSASGQHGFSVRVLPSDDRLVCPFVPGLITWDVGQQTLSPQLVTA
jgi:starch phosphorylase